MTLPEWDTVSFADEALKRASSGIMERDKRIAQIEDELKQAREEKDRVIAVSVGLHGQLVELRNELSRERQTLAEALAIVLANPRDIELIGDPSKPNALREMLLPVAELCKDQSRLDWLFAGYPPTPAQASLLLNGKIWNGKYYENPREAIDAAMRDTNP